MSETANCIRLGFVGDVCLADNYTPVIALDEIGSTDVTDGVDARFVSLMHDMDLMWANNEFCYSDRGERMPNKQFAFRAKTANVRYLADLGVNVAGLANNHVFDYGEQAFLDTLETLEGAGIPYVGAGRNIAAAQAPVYLQAGGLTVAYVAASRAEKIRMTPEATDTTPGILLCYDNSRFIASIREAAAHADYVVALPHWGTERTTELEDAQTHGAHAYLGNFWFDGFKGLTALAELQLPLTAEGAGRGGRGVDPSAVRLVLHPGWQQMAITSWIDIPGDRANAFRHIERISVNASIDETGFVSEA